MATSAADRTIELWDAYEWTSERVFSSFKFPARSIDFSHDGEWLAAGGEDDEVHLVGFTDYITDTDFYGIRADFTPYSCFCDN